MSAYTFRNAGLVVEQLGHLEQCLDPATIRHLGTLEKGARCWEVGAGGGSIATFLAEQVGDTGHVVASDIDVSRLGHLAELGNVTVVEHDLSTLTAPDPGPYDLIHARLVLVHLPRRREILRTLVDRLRPGGVLMLEEFDCTEPPMLHRTTGPGDEELFGRVIGGILAVLQTNGADLHWARDLHAAMLHAGLQDIHTIIHSESWQGGSAGAQLHATNARQLADQLVQRGVSDIELNQFTALMANPNTVASLYPLVCARGQRPEEAAPSSAGRHDLPVTRGVVEVTSIP